VWLPLYEYRCLKCNERVEKIQKFSDPLLTTCPKCGGELERLISSPAIQFKGSGWYVTDYARKSGPQAGKSDGSGSGAGKQTSQAPQPTATKDNKPTADK
jgi:putative FmdB family regulatory protein